MTLALFFFLLMAPEGPSLLENLDDLTKELHASEEKLRALEEQKQSFELELATLRTQLAENEIAFSAINTQFKKRIRSLAKMPNGARVAVIGGAESLQDYLRVQRMLRLIASYDRELQEEHLEKRKVLTKLSQEIQSKEDKLEETSREILANREAVVIQRDKKLHFLQEILNSRPQTRQLALEFLRINQKLTQTIGTLTPGPANNVSIRKHSGSLPWPTLGELVGTFGQKVEIKSSTVTTQNGITLKAPYGTQVFAIFEGVVAHTGWLPGYGKIIIIDHNDGFHSIVGHLRSVTVRQGQEVDQLDPIGTVGDSGSLMGTQLYFELRHEGKSLDPLAWLRKP